MSDAQRLTNLDGLQVFGRTTPPPIDTRDSLENEVELLRALSGQSITTRRYDNSSDMLTWICDADLKVAASVLSAPSAAVHPLEQQYNSLKAILSPISPETAVHTALAKMLAIETESERSLWRFELTDAFAIEREGERVVADAGGRKLLWYGAQGESSAKAWCCYEGLR